MLVSLRPKMHSYNKCLKYLDRDWAVREQHKDFQIVKEMPRWNLEISFSLCTTAYIFSVKYQSSWDHNIFLVYKVNGSHGFLGYVVFII